MTDILVPKSSKKYTCNICNYITCRKSQYGRHLLTPKHNKSAEILTNTDKKVPKSSDKLFTCDCGKKYKHRQSLFSHKKSCKVLVNNITTSNKSDNDHFMIDLLKQNQEFKDFILEQNNHIIQLIDKPIANTTFHNITNNNNTTNFNLHFFLNEQCKDALNIMEFVNSIKLQLSDLDMMGRLGYTEGISKIFIRGLKELDVFKRPIHCSVLKRETLYVKDKDAWEKENGENIKIKQAINYIANKNIKQLPQWMDENPSAKDTETKKHMDYVHIVHECMGGSSQESQERKHNKIIRNIAKEVIIEKT